MADVNINDLKPNSNKYKAEQAAKATQEKITPIVKKEEIVTTKKPLGKKMSEKFLNKDLEDVKDYVIQDLIIPGIKDSILDILSMMFFGETIGRSRSSSRNRDRNYGRTNYNSSYRDRGSSRRRRDRRDDDDRYLSDDKVDYRNIILRSRGSAEELIDNLHGRIRDRGSVSIAEMLDMLELSSKYTDNNWGWTSERQIGLRRVSEGYLIDVDEAEFLN